MDKKTFSKNQLGSLVTMAIMAVWGVWVSWLHMTRPLGMELTEALFLSALLPGYLIALPFYWRRVRWGYISGMIVLLGLFAGLAKTVVDHTFFFSLSVYNLTIVAVFLAALACIYFSLRSYFEAPPVWWRQSALGIGVLLAISALPVWFVSSNSMGVENKQLRRVIQGVQARTGDIETLDDKIEILMAEGDIHSLAAAIVVGDSIIWLKGYGQQPDPDMLYDIGSIAKSFTATAVLQLYERGLIGLDDDVNEYLPFILRHPDYPDTPITIRMLLTHRSCLAHNTELYRSYTLGSGLVEWGVKQRGWETHDEFEHISFSKFFPAYLAPGGAYYRSENWAACQPGTDAVYSTPGFDLLGYLVERVSGQSFTDYLQENIFDPLEMDNTTATPLDTPERMAPPYELWYGVLAKTNIKLPLYQRNRVGGGGLYSTPRDLANFLLAHMNTGQFNGYQLLRPETVELMHSPVSKVSWDFMQTGYGYGWALFQEAPRQMWEITYRPRGAEGHGGRSWGYSSAMYMVEDTGGAYGYVALINTSMAESMDQPMALAIQGNIQDLILGEAFQLYRKMQD